MKRLLSIAFVLCACLEAMADSYTDSHHITWDYVKDGNYAIDVCPVGTLSGIVEIPSMLNGYVVKSIALGAFIHSTYLTKVIIPPYVETIGANAFYGNCNLESVNIPSGVKTIGAHAFEDTKLSSITIPLSVVSMDITAFHGCSYLKRVAVSDLFDNFKERFGSQVKHYTIIEGSEDLRGNFSGCSQMESVSLPSTLKHIGFDTFRNCTGLTEITIPPNVLDIKETAFDNCSNLKKVTILSNSLINYYHNKSLATTFGNQVTQYVLGKNVTEIGSKAFYGCSNLKTIDIPMNVSDIGWEAFYGCSSLTKIYIPINVTNLKRNVFEGCSALTEVYLSPRLKTIGSYAFRGCSRLRSIVIPKSVETIDDGAFLECNNLDSVIVRAESPGKIRVVGYENYNWSHVTLIVPQGCVSAYQDAIPWKYCKKIVGAFGLYFEDKYVRDLCIANWDTNGDGFLSLYEAAAVKTLDHVFDTNKNITLFDELEYFKGLTSIDGDFSGCSNLAYITIPNSVTSVGSSAFKDCSNLASISIPNSVKTLGEKSFSGCSSLSSITIPNSVTNIESSTFQDCSNLASVSIPNSVKTLGEYSFSGCSSLSSITIPNSVTSIGNSAFKDCSNLTSITLPESVTSIESSAFYGCSSLDSVTIPKNLKTLGEYSFSGCRSLSSITIPESVTSIGKYAFADCDLTSVVVEWDNPIRIIDDIFPNRANTTLSVPFYSYRLYVNSFYWKDFKSIIMTPFNPGPAIIFTDDKVKALCVANWDYNGDGELNEVEADHVKDLGKVFENQTGIKTFNELQYFTALTNIGSYTFNGCSGLTAVTIPSGITSVNSYAFSDCAALTSITIPQGVTFISTEAFKGCKNLLSITIPSGVTEIGSKAFHGCTGLTSLSIPSSVKTIGNGAFSGCSGLTTIDVDKDNTTFDSRNNCNAIISTSSNELIVGCQKTIVPDGVITIGRSAFQGCNGLNHITIPNSVTSIGNNAFMECTSLTAIDIPNSLINIGENAFEGCSSLSSFTVPYSLTSIGNNAFKSCSSLSSVSIFSKEIGDWFSCTDIKEVIIGDQVTNIGEYAFYCCRNLSSITIPATVISIGEKAFAGCSSLSSFIVPCSVTSIGNDAFEGCSGLISVGFFCKEIGDWFSGTDIKEIIIGDEVTIIGECAFANCRNLSSSNIPNNVTSIGNSAFGGCTSLSSFSISNSVTNIGESAFRGCSSLSSFTIPNSVTNIGKTAFKNCSSLSSFTILNSVTSIGEGVFSGCSSLTSITIPSTVTSMGPRVFSDCSGLTSLNIFCKEIVELGNCAVKEVVIGDGVKTIGAYAFRNCTKLTSVTIPNSVTMIRENAFEDCHSLNSIIIPNSIPYISANTFRNCRNLTSIIIPNSVDGIYGEAFYGCSSLTSISIPNSVWLIGYNAFSGCSSLTSITIPYSVTSIGEHAFWDCSSLNSVMVERMNPNEVSYVDKEIFSHPYQATLYVPIGCKTTYQRVYPWRKFMNIVERSSTSSPTIDFADVQLKLLCVANWDTSGDGELSESEAAAVSNLGQMFKGNTQITSFNELQYFTGLSSIGKDAFNGCTALKSIVIPTNVKSIGESAFLKCRGLSTVVIPNSVTSIAQRAFGLCDGLKDVSLPGSVTLMNGVFSGCENIEKISISDIASWCAKDKSDWLEGLEDSNGYKLYVNGVEVKELVIPSSVTSIGKESFIFCSGITSVVIPNGVTDIRSSAFFGCNALTSVTVGMQTPPAIDTWTFSNRTNTTLHVPAGCKTAYQAANYWKEFKIEEVDGTNTEVDVDVTDISKLDNAIYIEPFTARVGDNVDIEVKLKNADTATSYGFELQLPDGLSIAVDGDGSFDESITLSSRNSKHNVTTNKLNGNVYKIDVASLSSKSITDNDGLVLTIKAHVQEDMAEGLYQVAMYNPLIVYTNGVKPSVQKTYTTVTVENDQKGDVNGDGEVDILDATLIVYYVLGRNVTLNIEAGDVNGDSEVDILDATLIVYRVLGRDTNPAAARLLEVLDPQ